MIVRNLLFPVLASIASVALAGAGHDTEFSGFGTLSAVSSSSAIYGFRPDVSYNDGSTDGDVEFMSASLLGGQVDYSVSAMLSFTAQGIIRDRVENKLDDVVSQLFLKYSINAGLNVRLGRLPLDLFALTEFRDITYAYPWAVAPTEVYGIVPNRYLDGLDLSYTKRLKASAITAKFFAGQSETIISSPENVDHTKIKNIVGLSVDWSTLDWYVKLRHTQGVFNNNSENVQIFLDQLDAIPEAIWPSGGDFLERYAFENKQIKYTSVSGQYALERWTIAGEYALIQSDVAALERIEGGYASLTYRVDDLAGFISLGYSDSNTYTFDEIIAVPPELFPNYDAFVYSITGAMHAFSPQQNSVSIGARYELSDAIALKLQWTKTQIKERGGALWAKEFAGYGAETVDTLFMSMSFIF